MLKFIGGAAVVGAVAIGAAVYFGWADVDANASLTDKSHAEIQSVRNKTADAIRGEQTAPTKP